MPNCASQSPASGDGNLIGHQAKMQEKNEVEILRKLSRGSTKFFPIFNADTGFQVFGKYLNTN